MRIARIVISSLGPCLFGRYLNFNKMALIVKRPSSCPSSVAYPATPENLTLHENLLGIAIYGVPMGYISHLHSPSTYLGHRVSYKHRLLLCISCSIVFNCLRRSMLVDNHLTLQVLYYQQILLSHCYCLSTKAMAQISRENCYCYRP